MTLLHLHADALGYRDGAPVLRDVSLSVAPGEAVALLGGNGAGKTALLHWIAGVLPRAGGRCTVGGLSVDAPKAAVRAGVGLVVQDPDDQLLGATVEDDVAMGPRNLGLAASDVLARTSAALSAVGMTALAARPIETLSFGERKRASLAGVLAMAPRLLLLDEPTAGLDPLGERAFCQTLRATAASGTALLVATHAVDLVPYFATRVILLGEGRVLADGPCREVLAKDSLLARARVRRPWPAELWACAPSLHRADAALPLTLEEVLPWLTPASS